MADPIAGIWFTSAAVSAGLGAWLSLGMVAVTDAERARRVGVLPPWWLLAALVLTAALLAIGLRLRARASLPLFLPLVTIRARPQPQFNRANAQASHPQLRKARSSGSTNRGRHSPSRPEALTSEWPARLHNDLSPHRGIRSLTLQADVPGRLNPSTTNKFKRLYR